jgi:hypothetical protein
MERKNMEIKMKKRIRTLAATIAFFYVGISAASTLSIPNSFSSGGTTSAADMNSNFSAVVSSVNDNDTRITELERSSAPVFQGFSASTADGADGIRAMKSACDVSFSGSKICTTSEFVNSTYNSSASNLTGSAWLLPDLRAVGTDAGGGLPGILDKASGIFMTDPSPAQFFLCNNWNSDDAGFSGTITNSSGVISTGGCANQRAVACCK